MLQGKIVWLMVACALLQWPQSGETRDAPSGGPKPTLSLVVENDLFNDEDRHYTSGVRLSWVSPGDAAPNWARRVARAVPFFPRDGIAGAGYAVGQSMFTPSDLDVVEPSLDDRPYAGWLYGTVGVGVENGRQLDQVLLTVGMVGPASLGEQSQKFFHKLTGVGEPKGWDTQLRNELGLMLTYQRTWRAPEWELGRYSVDWAPHVGATAGNVFTYANAGLTLRAGYNLPQDYGPPRIPPGVPGSSFSLLSGDFGWYLFAGMEGRAVARNIFLDGNTFRSSRSVDRKVWVGDLQFGAVLAWQDFRVAYTHIFRSNEFETQRKSDSFGAISVSVSF